MKSMPNRILRDGILTSDRVSKLTWEAEVFYRRLMSVVDDFGRFDGRIAVVKAAAYPLALHRVSDADLEKWIDETERAGLIKRYTQVGKPYLVLLDFRQQVRAKRSKYPEPPPGTCVADAQQMIAYAHLDGVGDGDEDGTNTYPARESVAPCDNFTPMLTKEEAISQTALSGVDPAFAEFVYADWLSRGGRDGGGCLVTWLPYCTKRWGRERVQWIDGTHKGKNSKGGNGHNNSTGKPVVDRNAGTYNENWDIEAAKRKVR